jgi:hypothetical protein
LAAGTTLHGHRAGEALEVDWADMTLSVIDAGVAREAQPHLDWFSEHHTSISVIADSRKMLGRLIGFHLRASGCHTMKHAQGFAPIRADR